MAPPCGGEDDHRSEYYKDLFRAEFSGLPTRCYSIVSDARRWRTPKGAWLSTDAR